MAKMKVVYFATHNRNKVRMAKEIAEELGLALIIKHLKVEYPEDKSREDFSFVAKKGAEFCANKYKKKVFVTDIGIEVETLKDFPGINTGFVLRRIGVEGIIKLMRGEKNRKVRACLALAYCEPGKKPIVWQGSIKGKIPTRARGKRGFGWDPIFIPNHHKQTFGENPDLRNRLFSFRKGILKMCNEWIK